MKKITGVQFQLPKGVEGKDVSVIEVGPFQEPALAAEINRFLGTDIKGMTRINTYILVHPQGLQGIEQLVQGKPFVDPIIHRAALNGSLADELGLEYNHVLQSHLNPGTSDSQGKMALRQMMLSLGRDISEGDNGFYSPQFFVAGDLNPAQLEAISAFLANPNLNQRANISAQAYKAGFPIEVPIVTLPPEIKVKTYDVAHMSDDELVELSSNGKFAATLEEMKIFADIYKDSDFLEKRRELGLTGEATDVEAELYFGLRSEHCFHKEFNAKITLEDRANDPVFQRAFERGWLAKNDKGEYVLEEGLFKTFIRAPAEEIFKKLEKRGKNWIASMFTDNSGIVYYDEDFMFCIKFETHNSPSNKDPIQGAKTGIDGVNRDIFATMLGTFIPISNHFFYCTGNPEYRGWLPPGVKHPYELLKGVDLGVTEGGNESQIATLGGGLIVDPRNIAKILLHAGTIGWSPVRDAEGRSYLDTDNLPSVGDLVYVAGHAVGRDGIHGATESSLKASALISLGHVQADDSFTQVKMRYWIEECALAHLFTEMADSGAMGLGATAEMARRTNGIWIDMARHPKKYVGIQPCEIIASETQDRMFPFSKPEHRQELMDRAKLHDVELTELGHLTDSGYIHLQYQGDTVALVPVDRLFDPEPRKHMHATWSGTGSQDPPQIKESYSLEETLCILMSTPDNASPEWFFRQKDSQVGGMTIQGPMLGLKQEVEADATIQKPLDTEGKDYGAIAYSWGIRPKITDIDPYHASQIAFLDMAGKIIACGAALPDMDAPKWDAWAICGNYCQPNSEGDDTLTRESGEHNLASLIREGIGVRELEEKLNLPVISGKDSMKCSCEYEVDDSFDLEGVPLDLRKHVTLVEDPETGTRKIEIHDPDSYLVSGAVKIKDYRKCVTPDFKRGGDAIYVAGITRNELGASQLLSGVGYKEQGAPIEGGNCPKADLDAFTAVGAAVYQAIDEELVASCKYVHNGGLGVAITKAALAGDRGADLDLYKVCTDGSCKTDTEILGSETPGRWLVTVDLEHQERFEEIMASVPCSQVGTVTENDRINTTGINYARDTALLPEIKKPFQETLRFDLDVALNKQD
ncbi:MAG: AIR synthase-related protein [Candidatus Woesearchaeota archaeon]